MSQLCRDEVHMLVHYIWLVSGWSLAIFTLHLEEEGDGRGEVTIQIYAAITYFLREESFAINLCFPKCMSVHQGLSCTCLQSNFRAVHRPTATQRLI